MFARLLLRQRRSQRSRPGPGRVWEISEDDKTYTFHLADAHFSDGTPITAEDVAFSYTRMRFQKDTVRARPSSRW